MLHPRVTHTFAAKRRPYRANTRIDVRIDVSTKAPHSREVIRRAVRTVLERAVRKVIPPRYMVALDVIITDDKEIRRLNAAHRGIDRCTDSLSFPQFSPREARALWAVTPPKCFLGAEPRHKARKGAETPPTPEIPLRRPVPLGDIVLSLPMIERQAARRDTTLLEEVEFVVAHSFLHLLGCDHDTPARRRAMWDYTHLLLYDGRTP